ncbi:MAG: 3-keto-5-aminohexanoate cleavage protein [Phycisphaerae bacterium]
MPVTPEEIAQDAYDCYNAGASVVHIHARDKEQKPSHDFDFFAATLEKIKNKFEKQCSHCGCQFGNTWEYSANSFRIALNVDCCSTQALWGEDKYRDIDFNHPAIEKGSGYQSIILKSGISEPYRLCPSCNRKFIKTIGDFLQNK